MEKAMLSAACILLAGLLMPMPSFAAKKLKLAFVTNNASESHSFKQPAGSCNNLRRQVSEKVLDKAVGNV
jgi:hypothetical protein